MRNEDQIYLQLGQWLQSQHPKIPFHFDLGSGGVLTVGMATRNKRMNPITGWPDFCLPVKRGDYSGLWIEIKTDDEVLIRPKDAKKILKDETKLRLKGDWFNDHIEEQAEMLSELRKQGFCAVFGVGFDNCLKIINEYLKS